MTMIIDHPIYGFIPSYFPPLVKANCRGIKDQIRVRAMKQTFVGLLNCRGIKADACFGFRTVDLWRIVKLQGYQAHGVPADPQAVLWRIVKLQGYQARDNSQKCRPLEY